MPLVLSRNRQQVAAPSSDDYISHVSVQADHPVDYFTLRTDIRPIPQRWPNTAVASLDLLRKAHALRPRTVTTPENLATTIAATERLETQVAVQPGSWLWNVQCLFSETGGAFAYYNISVLLTDTASGVPLSKYYASGGAYGITDADNLYLPAMPKPITGQGLLNVEICNYSQIDLTGLQILLFFAEPVPDVRQQLAGGNNQRSR
jgi:hypothetical protein